MLCRVEDSKDPAARPRARARVRPRGRRIAGGQRGHHPRAEHRLRASCHRRIARLRLLARSLHGQVTYESPAGPRTLAFERGTVDSVRGGAVTVTSADGTTWTWHLTGRTVIRQDGRLASRTIRPPGSAYSPADPSPPAALMMRG